MEGGPVGSPKPGVLFYLLGAAAAEAAATVGGESVREKRGLARAWVDGVDSYGRREEIPQNQVLNVREAAPGLVVHVALLPQARFVVDFLVAVAGEEGLAVDAVVTG